VGTCVVRVPPVQPLCSLLRVIFVRTKQPLSLLSKAMTMLHVWESH
jgi:hypothetical protein